MKAWERRQREGLLRNGAFLGQERLVRSCLSHGIDISAQDDAGQTALHFAAEKGHARVVELLLQHNPPARLDLVTNSGLCALMFAARNGHGNIVEMLLDAGASVVLLKKCGATVRRRREDLLRAGAQVGVERLVQACLSKDVDINAKDDSGQTALHFATDKGHARVVELLLQHNPPARVDLAMKSGESALMLAARNGYGNIVETLLDAGAEVDLLANDGCTAVFRAVTHGRLDVTTMLIDRGADMNRIYSGRWTILLVAAAEGKPGIVRFLMQRGALLHLDMRMVEPEWDTPMMVAVQRGKIEVVRELLESPRYAALNWARSDGGCTALHDAARANALDIVKLLVEHGAGINTRNRCGATPIAVASGCGHAKIVQFLVNKGASVHISTHAGWTPVLLAAYNSCVSTVGVLKGAGATFTNGPVLHIVLMYHACGNMGREDIFRDLLESTGQELKADIINRPYYDRESADPKDINTNGMTLLTKAAAIGRKNIVGTLLREGADVNKLDDEKASALHQASIHGHTEVVRLLIEHGADVNIGSNQVDNEHITPLSAAAICGHPAIVEMLRNAQGANLHLETGCGLTTFDFAVLGHDEPENVAVAKQFLQDGRNDVSERPKALMHASSKGAAALVKLLLESGSPSLDYRNEDGDAALHLAARQGYVGTVLLLLEHKAPLGAKNLKGQTPLDVADKRKNDMVKAMKRANRATKKQPGLRASLDQTNRNDNTTGDGSRSSADVAEDLAGTESQCVWEQVLEKCQKGSFANARKSWADMCRDSFDEEETAVTVENGAMHTDDSTGHGASYESLHALTRHLNLTEDANDWIEDAFVHEHGLLLAEHVTKWIKNADARNRALFIGVIRCLPRGDRRQTFTWKIPDSKSRVSATLLEPGHQQCILWTFDADRGMLIWSVSDHATLSRITWGIVQSIQMSAGPLTKSEVTGEDAHDDPSRILLDPTTDVPLKLYELKLDDLDRLQSSAWQPPLHLTQRGRAILEQKGTVCVLGRSGTGKTACISNRIARDRRCARGDPSFSQLFIARSQSVCNMVKNAVGDENGPIRSLQHLTHRDLLLECEVKLPNKATRDAAQCVDYRRFKNEIYDVKNYGLDPHVVWTQFRSIIKGSILVIQVERPPFLSRQECLDLGSEQCLLSTDQRKLVHRAFQAYRKHVNEDTGLWDEMDRVAWILKELNADRVACDSLKRTKIYADEIQDYTQAELAFFFLLCSPSEGLFLAGDPAQSIEEGTAFRYEDVRRVAGMVLRQRSSLPPKPTRLRVNFRCHTGILDLASDVLDLLVHAFRGSVKKPGRDEGMFRGPRPVLFKNISAAELQMFAKDQTGLVVLTVDEDKVPGLQQLLGGNVAVLSIRQSKGLEFNSVLLLDFFNGMSKSSQEAWKDLLVNNVRSDIVAQAPEIERHLKLLYTAVTRCCKRLFIAEREVCRGRHTIALEAFEKRAITRRREKPLVDRMRIGEVKAFATKRRDLYKLGMQFAVKAEETSDPHDARVHMQGALNAFRQGRMDDLIAISASHLQSIEMRLKMQDPGKPDVSESTLAFLVKQLMEAGLLMEARKLCEAAQRVGCMEDNTRSRVISHLSNMH